MRDSLPNARYSPICNVLRQWKTSLIPIYRVYRLYDYYYYYKYKKHLKMNKEIGMILPKKELIQVEYGKVIIIMRISIIHIPPNNTTH